MNADTPADAIHIEVDIVSDVVCPWCVIGYKQFEKAVHRLPPAVTVAVRWQPFELNPRMPAEGQNLREHLAQKLGTTVDNSRAARDRLTQLGAELGFTFDFFDEMRVVNTFRAHQLLHWAGESGKQTALKLALFSAHFGRREDVNRIDTLTAVAASVGLHPEQAEEILTTQACASAVRAAQKKWLEHEIHAVPAFIFNNRYSVLGAQDAGVFERVFAKLLGARA